MPHEKHADRVVRADRGRSGRMMDRPAETSQTSLVLRSSLSRLTRSLRDAKINMTLLVFRLLAGVAAIFTALALVSATEPTLRFTIALLGAFIIMHQTLELVAVLISPGITDEDNRDGAAQNSFASIGAALISTPGVVLGLLAVFSPKGLLTPTIRVSAVSLATCLLLAIIVNGLVAMNGAEQPPLSTLIRLLFNVTLWALTLGLLGVAMALAFRGTGG